MSKIEFLTRLEAVKKRLPVGVIPLYLKVYPNEKLSRLKNTVGGRIQDEKILSNLEAMAEKLEEID
tara:strand:+ start:849 stop:1046 length:198 start_codon:yes stop_codon:yes gene_type:complete